MIGIFLAWLVITSSFLTILELPLGIEIDGYNRATFSALLVGGFNVTLHPMFVIFDFPHTFFTFGFFVFLINAVILGLIAIFVKWFYLNGGFWSIFIASLTLSIINSLLFNLLSLVSQ
ncbi:MAG TPA: phage holin family protein [Candidatus Sericytochromatia bacterium]|jgi:putative membrane protein